MSSTDATIVFEPGSPVQTTVTQDTPNVFDTGVTVSTPTGLSTLTVGDGSSFVNVRVTLSDLTSTFTYAGFSDLVAGTPKSATITVTANNGTTATYKFNLTRASLPGGGAATNATASFAINGTQISDNGSTDVTGNTNEITITPAILASTLSNGTPLAGATYTVTIGSITSSSYTGQQTLPLSGLSNGANTITVLVTARNGTTTRTYTFTVNATIASSASSLDANNADTQNLTYSLDSASGGAIITNFTGTNAEGVALVIPNQVILNDGNTYDVVGFDVQNNYWSVIGNKKYASITVSNDHPYLANDENGYLYQKINNEFNVIWAPYSITHVDIPNQIKNTNVTKIYQQTFNGHLSVTAVTIGSNVTQIANNAFMGCPITSITIPNTVSSIGNGAFAYCRQLTSATIPNTVTVLEGYIFLDCPLSSLDIPNTVTSIGESAFGSSLLTEVTIPASVTYIDKSAFGGCSLLTNFAVNPANTMYAAQDGITYQKVDADNASVYMVFGTVTNVNIPATIVIGGGAGIPVTYIANNSFYGQKSLTAVMIGSNVKTIGYSAFGDDTSLNNVMFDANSLIEIIHAGAFSYTSMVSFIVPDSVTLFEGCFDGVVSLVELTINNSITTTDSFGGLTSLVTLNYPVDHPNFVSDTNGFLYSKIDNDTHLSLVWIPNLIGSVTIPAAYNNIPVTSIGDRVFQNQTITSVTNNAPLVTIGDRIFENNMNVETFLIPNTVTSIASMAFYSSGLKSIIIPDSVTVMTTCQGCSKLTSCTIGSGITELNLYSFAGVSMLNELVIGPNVTLINGACSGMTALKDVYFLGNNETALYEGQNYDFFGYGQFVQDRNAVPLVSAIAPDAVAHYVDGKSGWDVYSSDAPPAGFSDIQTFDPEGSDSAPDHSSGVLNLNGGSVGAVSGGDVNVSAGDANIQSTTGAFALALNGGNANVTTLNGSVSANATISANRILSTSAGTFAGLLYGSGTLEKTGSGTLTLSGSSGMGFSGKVAIKAGTVEAQTTTSLSGATVELGSSGLNTSPVLKFNISDSTTSVIGNSIRALSSGSNTVQNAGTAPVSLAGGVEKNGTVVYFEGKFLVNSDITGSSANSDVVLGTADVTLVSGNTYDYNGPTTVNTGSTLTLQDGVALPDSDVTINVGATLVLEYITSTITANSVNSLTLGVATTVESNAGIYGGQMIVNISSNLTAGDYTVLAVNTYGLAGLSQSEVRDPIQVNYTGSNGSSASITQDSTTGNYVVTITAAPTPTSNVCFPAKTPIMTNLGPVNIEDIDPTIHTIRNKKIVAITKTVAHDKNLVRIAKHALGHLYPEKTTFISQNHKVFCQGQMIKAKHLVDDCNVTLVPYNGQVLYNVLLEEHEKMQVNNLIVETLHPEHKVAKLYRFLKNVDAAHHGKFIAAFNKKDLEHRSHL